jgi:hypothetical protein
LHNHVLLHSPPPNGNVLGAYSNCTTAKHPSQSYASEHKTKVNTETKAKRWSKVVKGKRSSAGVPAVSNKFRSHMAPSLYLKQSPPDLCISRSVIAASSHQRGSPTVGAGLCCNQCMHVPIALPRPSTSSPLASLRPAPQQWSSTAVVHSVTRHCSADPDSGKSADLYPVCSMSL